MLAVQGCPEALSSLVMESATPRDPVRCLTAFDPVTIEPRATLGEASKAMCESMCGCLLVEQRDGQLAVVTERDIVRGLADHGLDAGDWVTDVMTRDVVTVPADMSIADAAQVMIDAGIRHLVVEDQANSRIGVVSVRDILPPLVEAVD